MFLPQMKQANLELEEKIKLEGIEGVRIDKDLLQPSTVEDNNIDMKSISTKIKNSNNISKENSIFSNIENNISSNNRMIESDSDSNSDSEEELVIDEELMKKRIVQLEFALGDFDQNPVALAEEELKKEEEEKKIDNNDINDEEDD